MKTHTTILNRTHILATSPVARNFLLFVVASLILIKAMGYGGTKGIDILFISLSLLLLSAIPLTRYFLVIPYIIFCAIYAPVGMIYGPPSISVVSALFQTNRAEAIEFLRAIPAGCYLLPCATLLTLFILARYSWQRSLPLKKILPFLVIFIVLLFARILSGGVENLKLVNFFSSLISSYQSYNQQIAEIEASTHSQPSWNVDSAKSNEVNYVIVVGESMRRDYMSLFGYPTSTTPFLDKVNGTFYSNYISTAPNTFESLPRTLALSEGKKSHIADNIITLAKTAGLHTHWFSNQGLLGEFDTPISKIAMFSDEHQFLKKGIISHVIPMMMSCYPCCKAHWRAMVWGTCMFCISWDLTQTFANVSVVSHQFSPAITLSSLVTFQPTARRIVSLSMLIKCCRRLTPRLNYSISLTTAFPTVRLTANFTCAMAVIPGRIMKFRCWCFLIQTGNGPLLRILTAPLTLSVCLPNRLGLPLPSHNCLQR